jgi:pyruvate dehydrogenase E2 component (dihydrolipoamide acetyltransferase)
MAELITMPKLGFDMAEGTLEEWVKKAGDEVAEGDVIAVIATDKASVEVTAFRSGVLRAILQEVGSVVPIGAPIAVVGAADEEIDLVALGVGERAAEAPPVPAPAVVAVPAEEAPPSERLAAEAPERGRVLASPVAVRMAGELGIDLRQVRGSGPEGRIIKRDIEAHLKEREKAPSKAPPPPPIPTPSYEPTMEAYHAEPLSPMRQTIGRRMVESKQQAPHFYITMEVDMAAAMALRSQLNALIPEEEKVSVNDLITKAAAIALRQFPKINASFAGDEIRVRDQVNIGMAVAREAGLLTVVVRDCDKKSLAQIARETRQVVGRARDGRMKPDDMVGGTFTISNLGMFDVDDFIAIINPPQAAILAVGAVKPAPVVDEGGQLTVSTRMKVTISADHRVTDGAEAARFLQAVKAALEQPLKLLL